MVIFFQCAEQGGGGGTWGIIIHYNNIYLKLNDELNARYVK